MTDWIKVGIKAVGHKGIDFEARRLRSILRRMANEVRADARRLISRNAISKAGEYPRQGTGDTRRSLSVRIVNGGYTAIVEPKKTSRMNERDFYPAILTYGTAHIKPRKNYIVDAAERRRNTARQAIYEGLRRALRPI